MFTEDDLLPLSGLQHMAFCERQWALIHLEQQWEENPLTAEGHILHERAHDSATETRGTLVTVRALPLHSLRLGISGQADVVEFHALEPGDGAGAVLEDRAGRWRPCPVEYKRGKPSAPRPCAWKKCWARRCRRPRSSTPLRAAATRCPSRPSFERRPRPFASACTSYTACGRHPRLSTRPPARVVRSRPSAARRFWTAAKTSAPISRGRWRIER